MPDTWGFTRKTADKLVALVNDPPTISRARTQRNKTPWLVGGGGATKIVKTPSGGIAARSSTSVSTESCVVQSIDSGSLVAESESIDVVNIWPVALPGDFPLLVTQEDTTNEWIAIFPGIIDVRYVLDTALEHSTDKVTYTNVETPEDC